MTTPAGLKLQGIDVSTYKASVTSKPDWMASPVATADEQALGSGLGAVLGDPLVGARSLSFQLLVRGTSNDDMLAQVDALYQLCYTRSVTVTQSRRADRQITGTCLSITEQRTGPRDLIRSMGLTVVLRCGDPRWRHLSPTAQNAITSSPTTLLLGTAKVEDWTGAFHGASTDAVATIRDGGGIAVAQFGWTGSLGSGETLAVSAAEGMTRKGSSLAPMDTWTGAYPVLDPNVAKTIEISSGTLDLSFFQADWN